MDKYELKRYQKVQRIAVETTEYLKNCIKEGVSEKEIADIANKFMIEKGASSFWYYNVGALVLVGERTLLSISGRDYTPTDNKIKKTDLISIDLGPEIDSYWGDYARSFVILNGKIISSSEEIEDEEVKELLEGIEVEEKLHKILQKVATLNMTFEELFLIMNKIIGDLGYQNLDFKGNLGHSIEKNKGDRIYIEKGNEKKLTEASLFTFEPHIKRKNGRFGYKKEDIYYFSDGKLMNIIPTQ